MLGDCDGKKSSDDLAAWLDALGAQVFAVVLEILIELIKLIKL